jgi:polysaccharide biosynthesis transport protein
MPRFAPRRDSQHAGSKMSNRTPPSKSASDPLAMHLRLLQNVRKHWLIASSITVLVCTSTVYYTLGQTKIYRSNTSLLIDPTPPRPLGRDVQGVVDLGTGQYWNNHEYYETQYRILKSRTVARDTVLKLGLHRDPTFARNVPEGSPLPRTEPDEKAAIGALVNRLSVDPVKESRIVQISFEDADPERARRVLTALTSIYIDKNVDRVLDSTRSASQWLGVQLERLKSELDDNELALHNYKKDKHILSVSMGDQTNMLREEMQQLNAELTRVRVEQQTIRSRYEQLSEVDPQNPSALPAQELLDSHVLSSLRASYTEAQQALTALQGSGKGDNHPETLGASARLESIRQSLVQEISNIKNALERSLRAKEREGDGLSTLFERAKTRALELNRLELDYRRLERSKTNTEKLYSIVLERSKESNLTQIMRFNNISVVDEATLPASPIKPRLPLNLAAGVLGGLLLGLGGALLRAAVDRTIKDPAELEQQLGASFLGLLPRAGKLNRRQKARDAVVSIMDRPELATHADPQSPVAEAARAIRTNLMFISPDSPKKRLLITSGGPSEGKTTVACSIAVAMAQTGLKVLLLDCDLRRPRLHQVFGLDNTTGVTSSVLEPDTVEPNKLRTEIPNLWVMPAGPMAPNPAEIVQSEHFGQLLSQLSEQFDRIVIDSPPVVAVTDAAILSTRVDGTVFVVRGGATRRELAVQALRTLRDVTDNVLGVVLNGADLSRNRYSGYYHHYRYYGDAKRGD